MLARRARSLAPKASESPGGTRKPVTPSLTTLGAPPTFVVITGTPAACTLDETDRCPLSFMESGDDIAHEADRGHVAAEAGPD